MEDENRRVADEPLVDKWNEYEAAKQQRAYWEAVEKDARTAILDSLGYDDGDQKPQPVKVALPNREALFEVRVSPRKGLDIAYLRKTFPDVYAMCEKHTPVKTLRAAE